MGNQLQKCVDSDIAKVPVDYSSDMEKLKEKPLAETQAQARSTDVLVPRSCQSEQILKGKETSSETSVSKILKKAARGLNQEERILLQNSWARIQMKLGKNGIGIGIYERIFVAQPQLKTLFRIPKQAEVSELDKHDHFKRHAGVFADLVDLLIENIYQLESEMGPILTMYGRRHWEKHRLIFKLEYLEVFADALRTFFKKHVDNDEEEQVGEETKGAWEVLVSFLVSKVAEGFNSQC